MRFRFFPCLLAISLCGLLSCSSTDSSVATSSSGTGVLYIAAQGDNSVTAYTVSLSNGSLTTLGAVQSTGNSPFAIALTPARDAIFADNHAADSVSSYTVNSDGSLTAGTGTVKTGSMPMGMAIDPGGKFLFVANQGSSSVSVFAITSATLKEVAGSPFSTIPAGSIVPTGPTAVAVSASGNFLYVANDFTGTVSAYSVSSAGRLSELPASPYTAGIAPSSLTLAPGGPFLYVANSGSNNISGFEICDKVVTSCADVNHPDGSLKPVLNSPFSDGAGPVAVAIDPAFGFLYVLEKGSNQISIFSYGRGTGVLTPFATTPTVSTGLSPVSFVIVSGATGTDVGNTTTNPTDYMYVVNNGASTLSAFTIDTTTGVLTPLGTAVSTSVNPTSIAVN